MHQQILYDHRQHFNNVCNSVLCRFKTHIVSKVQIFLYLLLLMVVNMYKHKAKVVIKILQRSAVTQTVLGGLTKVENFLHCIHVCVKIIKKHCLAIDTVIAKISSKAYFLAYPVDRPSLSTSG